LFIVLVFCASLELVLAVIICVTHVLNLNQQSEGQLINDEARITKEKRTITSIAPVFPDG